MSTPRWDLFAAVVILATLALLSLSRASASVISDDGTTGVEPAEDGTADAETGQTAERTGAGRAADETAPQAAAPIPAGRALLANVALTHGLLAVTVLALAWIAEIPLPALGLGDVTLPIVGTGVALGLGLYLASEAAGAIADRIGIGYDERLRELLAPDGTAEWVLLLVGVLPIIAGAEELLFRAALIGAVGAGFGLPAWALVVGSSILFGLGHSAQGTIGVAVTATFGLVLGAAFVLTGSLVVVVVAHYVVNALEFVVREGVYG